MESFKSKIKSIFKPKAPTYKVYKQSDLKTIAMKTRIVFDQHRNKLLQKIKQDDNQLRNIYIAVQPQILANLQSSQTTTKVVLMYDLLQQIGQKVIQAQSIVILKQLVKKIQDGRIAIIKTDGDIAKLKFQINYFRAALWFRKCKKIKYIDELHQFCFNFFKGIDITSQIDVKCQLFKLYPMLGLLNQNKQQLNMKELYDQLKHTLGWQMDNNIFNYMLKIGKQQKLKGNKNNSQIENNNKIINSKIISPSTQNINSTVPNANPTISVIKNPQNANKNQINFNDSYPKSQIRPPKNIINNNINNDTNYNNNSNNNYKVPQPYLPYNQPNQKANYYNPHPQSSYSINNHYKYLPSINDNNPNSINNNNQNNNNKNYIDDQDQDNLSSAIEFLKKQHKQQLPNQKLQIKQEKQKQPSFNYNNNNLSPKKPVSLSNLFSKKSHEKIQQVNKFQPIKQNNQRQFQMELLDTLDNIQIQKSNLSDFDPLASDIPFIPIKQQSNKKENYQNEIPLKDITQQYKPIFIPDTGSRIMRSSFNNFNDNDPYQYDQMKQKQQQLDEFEKQQLLNVELQQKISIQPEQIEKNKQIDDQFESISIIRNHIKPQPNKIKKPYMVSIYARKQYINKERNNNQF